MNSFLLQVKGDFENNTCVERYQTQARKPAKVNRITIHHSPLLLSNLFTNDIEDFKNALNRRLLHNGYDLVVDDELSPMVMLVSSQLFHSLYYVCWLRSVIVCNHYNEVCSYLCCFSWKIERLCYWKVVSIDSVSVHTFKIWQLRTLVRNNVNSVESIRDLSWSFSKMFAKKDVQISNASSWKPLREKFKTSNVAAFEVLTYTLSLINRRYVSLLLQWWSCKTLLCLWPLWHQI